MDKQIFPENMRKMMWVIALAIATMIALTGYISIQVAGLEKEIQELRQTE